MPKHAIGRRGLLQGAVATVFVPMVGASSQAQARGKIRGPAAGRMTPNGHALLPLPGGVFLYATPMRPGTPWQVWRTDNPNRNLLDDISGPDRDLVRELWGFPGLERASDGIVYLSSVTEDELYVLLIAIPGV